MLPSLLTPLKKKKKKRERERCRVLNQESGPKMPGVGIVGLLHTQDAGGGQKVKSPQEGALHCAFPCTAEVSGR